jgi:hypothetical protein
MVARAAMCTQGVAKRCRDARRKTRPRSILYEKCTLTPVAGLRYARRQFVGNPIGTTAVTVWIMPLSVCAEMAIV